MLINLLVTVGILWVIIDVSRAFRELMTENKKTAELTVVSVVEAPVDQIKTLAIRIRDAKIELKKTPGYKQALVVQKLIRERNELIAHIRGTVKLAYSFEGELVDNIVRKFG